MFPYNNSDAPDYNPFLSKKTDECFLFDLENLQIRVIFSRSAFRIFRILNGLELRTRIAKAKWRYFPRKPQSVLGTSLTRELDNERRKENKKNPEKQIAQG